MRICMAIWRIHEDEWGFVAIGDKPIQTNMVRPPVDELAKLTHMTRWTFGLLWGASPGKPTTQKIEKAGNLDFFGYYMDLHGISPLSHELNYVLEFPEISHYIPDMQIATPIFSIALGP